LQQETLEKPDYWCQFVLRPHHIYVAVKLAASEQNKPLNSSQTHGDGDFEI